VQPTGATDTATDHGVTDKQPDGRAYAQSNRQPHRASHAAPVQRGHTHVRHHVDRVHRRRGEQHRARDRHWRVTIRVRVLAVTRFRDSFVSHLVRDSVTDSNTNGSANHSATKRDSNTGTHVSAHRTPDRNANDLSNANPDSLADFEPEWSADCCTDRCTHRFTDESTYREANRHSHGTPVHRRNSQL